jgi:hypothetical protein
MLQNRRRNIVDHGYKNISILNPSRVLHTVRKECGRPVGMDLVVGIGGNKAERMMLHVKFARKACWLAANNEMVVVPESQSSIAEMVHHLHFAVHTGVEGSGSASISG